MDELWVQICDGGGQKSRPGDQSETEDTKSLNLIYRPVWKTGGACFFNQVQWLPFSPLPTESACDKNSRTIDGAEEHKGIEHV